MSDKDTEFDMVFYLVKQQAIEDLLVQYHAALSVSVLPEIISQAFERGYAARREMEKTK